jgi:hypothetical protein
MYLRKNRRFPAAICLPAIFAFRDPEAAREQTLLRRPLSGCANITQYTKVPDDKPEIPVFGGWITRGGES